MHLRLSAHIVAVAAAATSGGTTMTRTTFITTLAVLAIMVGADRVAWSQETLKVAIPQRGAWDAGVAELGQRGGIFKKHGLNLEILYVQAVPESIQAVIGGSMDIATASGVSAAVGTFAKGAPIRIIGSEMIGAPDLYWYVPANSPIQKVEDFNGKTVAFSLTGSSSHAGLLALIAQYKLTAKPTSTGNIASTITQTMTGQVDVGFGAGPIRAGPLPGRANRLLAPRGRTGQGTGGSGAAASGPGLGEGDAARAPSGGGVRAPGQPRMLAAGSEATSLPVAMMRILPSSRRSSPNGAAPKPTSTCPVIVCVIVDAILPVDVGLAVSLYCAMSASSPAWLDEPVQEKATVLPLKSSTFWIGELAGTYQ